MKRFRFFSSRDWLPAGTPHVPYLSPFWGAPARRPTRSTAGAHDRWLAVGREVAEESALGVAEAAMLPFDWTEATKSRHHREVAMRALSESRKAGKPLLVFFWNDDSQDLGLDGAIILRTSANRGPKYGVVEFACPSWQEDPRRWVTERGSVEEKSHMPPSISFCGYVGRPSGWRATAKELLRTSLGRFHPIVPQLRQTPLELRRAALAVLGRDRRLRTQFITRQSFYGGALRRRAKLGL